MRQGPQGKQPRTEVEPTAARVLVVAGSDSSGGAGIQVDVKTLHALGAYPMTAVTAITVQDSERVHEVSAVDPFLVERQMLAALDDIGADCIKIGMLATRTTVELVTRVCETRARGIPIVLDPVLLSTSGFPLLEVEGHATLIRRLMPLCALITPNAPEAELITGLTIQSESDLHLAADRLLLMGQAAVLIKGGHVSGDVVVDLLRTADGFERRFESPRWPLDAHGTGCVLASGVAAGLAQGYTLETAVERAEAVVQEAIKSAAILGRGRAFLTPAEPRPKRAELARGLDPSEWKN